MPTPLPPQLKDKAVKLRKSGWSIDDIAKELKIAKSTSSTWAKNVILTTSIIKRKEKRTLAKKVIYRKHLAKLRFVRDQNYLKEAEETLRSVGINSNLSKIYVALLYWAEGAKFADNRLEFTNSDPAMIQSFLKHLRRGFKITETKLRANIHLHEYHDPKTQTTFWSKTTNIPVSRFHKIYLKPHTARTIRDNYQGCVRICYYDHRIAREVKAIYLSFSKT